MQIFDNIENGKLVDALREELTSCERADFCVGYFSLRGWYLLKDKIDNLSNQTACRLLVGMQYPRELAHPKLQDLNTSTKHEPYSKKTLVDEFSQEIASILPSNPSESTLRDLQSKLRNGRVAVKAFLRHPLHAKLYLFFGHDLSSPSVGYVGSSNLTQSGLRDNGELNINLHDEKILGQLETWFNERWEDELCRDVTKDWIEVIQKSWVTPVQPYHVYLKMAHDLAHEGNDEFEIPASFRDLLYPFQADAVRSAAHYVKYRRGVMIGDVVGLGKTIMASAIIRIFQEASWWRALIICPPKLKDMWQDDYVDKYGLNAKVISNRLKETSFPKHSCDLVIIDESHYFRNRDTQSYEALKTYIVNNNSKVVLLSATPYNTDCDDLTDQLNLFVDENQDNISVRPERYLSEHPELIRNNYWTLKAFTAIARKYNYKEDWQNLMDRFLIRRTRSHIKEHSFPKRTPRVIELDSPNNDLDPYARLYSRNAVEKVVDQLGDLKLPRSSIGAYIKEQLPSKLDSTQSDYLKKLRQRKSDGGQLKGIYRTILFKRLESSGSTFLQSVSYHIIRDYVFLHGLQQGRIPLSRKYTSNLRHIKDMMDLDITDHPTGDEEELLGKLPKFTTYEEVAQEIYRKYEDLPKDKCIWIEVDCLKPSFKSHLEHDIQELRGLLKNIDTWQADTDVKLDKLHRLITDNPSQKILVFSQFADTVDYLKRELKLLNVTQLESVTNVSKNPIDIVKRFSPKSNDLQVAKSDQIRVLLTTDLLSEGQNLQDCHIVVNYDLPWGIIRLIQRAGRVDRIGQKAPEILCYSFMPATGVEDILSLRRRLRERLHESGEVLGTDEEFGFEREQLHGIAAKYSGVFDSKESEHDVSLSAKARKVWLDAIKKQPSLEQKIKELPKSAYSSKVFQAENDKNPEGVLALARLQSGENALAYINSEGDSVTESQSKIFEMAECELSTRLANRHEKHFPLVEKARDKITLRRLSPNSVSHAICNQLLQDENINKDHVLRQALKKMRQYPLQAAARDTLRKQWQKARNNNQLSSIIINLYNKNRLCETHEETREKIQIICSMGLFDDKTVSQPMQ